MIQSTACVLNILSKWFHQCWYGTIVLFASAQLPIDAFPPTIEFPITDGTHMVMPAADLGHIRQTFNQYRQIRIINSISRRTECPVDIRAHHVYVSLQC